MCNILEGGIVCSGQGLRYCHEWLFSTTIDGANSLHMPTNKSALHEAEFVDIAVSALLGGGHIEKVVNTPRVFSVLCQWCAMG